MGKQHVNGLETRFITSLSEQQGPGYWIIKCLSVSSLKAHTFERIIALQNHDLRSSWEVGKVFLDLKNKTCQEKNVIYIGLISKIISKFMMGIYI